MKRFILLFFFLPSLLAAQTLIYRSVKPDDNDNTGPIYTSGGTKTLTISGTTATFSDGAPDTMGVGCAIEYDSSNAGAVNAICFVSARNSPTSFTVQRFQGGTPASCSGDTDWNVNYSHTKLANIISGNENDAINVTVRDFDGVNRNINTANEQWNVACYRGIDSTATGQTLQNFATSTTDYLRIYTPTATSEVGVSQRHTGKRIRNCYQLVVHTATTSGNAIVVNGTTDNIFHLRIDGLFIKRSGGTAATAAADGLSLEDMDANDADIRVENCVIEGSDSVATTSTSHTGITCTSGAGVTPSFRIGNNIIYNFKTAGATTNEATVRFTSATGSLYCYQNTSYKNQEGFKHTSGFAYGKNCIGSRSGTDSYTGTWNAASTNLHSDAGDTPPGSNPITGTVTFQSVAGKNFLLHVTDTVAREAGVDLRNDATSGTFKIFTDILGESRPQGANFDIGAHEFTPASVLSTQKRVYIQ